MKLAMKLVSAAAAALMMAGVIAGCGSAEKAAGSSAAASAGAVRSYTVATRGTARPFSYVDDKGNLTGFDIEILKEVERRRPDLHFNFKTMDLSSAFIAMQSKQVDLIANQMTRRPEREKKYIFTDTVNNYTQTHIMVREDRDDIQTIDDLKGKKVASQESAPALIWLHEYDRKHNLGIQFVPINGGTAESINLVVTGRVDASLGSIYTIRSAKKDKGYPVKVVGEVVHEIPTYYLLRKDPEMQEAAKEIDGAVKEMKADGTLKKLSIQYLGEDYTESRKGK